MIGIVLQLARPMLLWIVQLAATSAGFAAIDWILNKLQEVVRNYYGIDEESSGAVVANVILDTLTVIGVGTAIIKAKIPIKAARRLGLDKDIPVLRKVAPVAAAKIAAIDGAAAKGAAKSYLTNAMKILGVPAALIWLTSAVANMIEPGIYKPEQTNAVYKALGIPFQYPTAAAAGTPGGFESGEFTDYVRALESAGAVGINNPCKLQSLPFNRLNLAGLVDCIYGQEVAAGRPTTASKLKPKLAQYITMVGGTTQPAASAAAGGVASSSVSRVRVFTGIVSQGKVGSSVQFTARQDDLIENVQELQDAAHNNLAATLAAIGNSLAYEIKVQTSVTTRDGFTQRGTTQQIQTGTLSNGTPRYKTVYNRFAVMNVYIVTDKGTRTKIRQIVLGPVNAITFQPTSNDLNNVENAVKGSIMTSDTSVLQSAGVGESVTPTTEAPTTQVSQETSPYVAVQPQQITTDDTYFLDREGNLLDLYREGNGRLLTFKPVQQLLTTEAIQKAGSNNAALPLALERLRQFGIDPTQWRRVPYIADIIGAHQKDNTYGGASFDIFFENTEDPVDRYEVIYNPTTQQWSVDDKITGTTKLYATRAGAFAAAGQTDTSASATGSTGNVCSATNLSQFYAALNKPLPTVAARSVLYAELGLGQASYYTGTVEQNAKLLAALKVQQGCAI